MLRCRLLGHRFRFSAEGATMRWVCARGCGVGGEKRYATAAEAERYARGFERVRAAESPDSIAELYELARPTVDEALRYELRRAKGAADALAAAG